MAPNPKTQNLVLPTMAVGRSDVSRMLREVEVIEEFMSQNAIRQAGSSVRLPKMSKLVDELVSLNKMNLLIADDRAKLLEFLKTVHQKAPVMHVSFNADPAPLLMDTSP